MKYLLLVLLLLGSVVLYFESGIFAMQLGQIRKNGRDSSLTLRNQFRLLKVKISDSFKK